MVVALSSAVGPTVASGILAVAPWPWIFAVNVPVGALAYFVANRYLPNTPQAKREFDYPSAILSAATLGLLVASIRGIAQGLTLVLGVGLGLTVVSASLLLRRQVGQTAPLFPIDLLRNRTFALSIATSVASFSAQMLAFVALPFYFESVLGRSAVETGFLLTPWPIAVVLMAPLAGYLSDRVSAGLLGSFGLLVMACGLISLATLPENPTNWVILTALAGCGAGFGLFQTPNNRILLQSAPKHRVGGASGMLATARLLGQTCGSTLAAVLFAQGEGRGPSHCLTLAAGFALTAALVSSVRLGQTSPSAVAQGDGMAKEGSHS
jgi:DHA2 family multidrug resistance protein-like MFS transporter